MVTSFRLSSQLNAILWVLQLIDGEYVLADDITIALCPVTEWTLATLPGNTIMLRVGYITSPEQPLDEPTLVSLVLTCEQALELALALRKKSAQARERDDD